MGKRKKVRNVELIRRRREKWARRDEKRRIRETFRALVGSVKKGQVAFESESLPPPLQRGTFYDVLLTPAAPSAPAGDRPTRR